MQGSSGHEAWDVHVDTGVSGGTLIEAAAGLLELKFNIGVPPGLESALKDPPKFDGNAGVPGNVRSRGAL